MPIGNHIPDKTLLTTIQRKMAKKCSSSPRVSVDVRSGEATLTGTIRMENERKTLVKCVSAVQGVSRVIDRIKLQERPKTA